MSDPKPTVLVVDDHPMNLEIIREFLSEQPVDLETAADGEEAWAALDAAPDRFDAVLLDRMMPRLDGLALLRRIKSDSRVSAIPVILQTAVSRHEEVVEGIRAGAHYYLTKPFEQDMLVSVLGTALRDRAEWRRLQVSFLENRTSMQLLERAEFGFRTLEEARSLAALLASFAPEPGLAVLGLSELMINAVEHGIAGVGYDEKTHLLNAGAWEDEITERLGDPSRTAARARALMTRSASRIRYQITDPGAGFDWQRYLELAPERAFDNHGRGIAIARQLVFSEIRYLGRGNEVVAVIELDGGAGRLARAA